MVEVPAGTDTNTISAIDCSWPSGAAGYLVFAGPHPGNLTLQADVDGTPPATVTLTSLNVRHWGVPDVELNTIRVKVKRVIHSGVFGIAIGSVTATTITINDARWTTNEWAGYIASVIGFAGDSQAIPLANFEVASNTADTLTLTGGSPDPTAVGVESGDVLIMRCRATTVSANTIGCARFDNSLALEVAKSVEQATNASPIVITTTGHGYVTNDQVRIDFAAGNTAANGIWTITKVNDDSFSLNSSTGNGAYTGGGIARRLTEGLTPDSEIGAIVRVLHGTGAGQTRIVTDNNETTYTLDRDWDQQPDDDSIWIVERPSWDETVETNAIDNSVPPSAGNLETLRVPVTNLLGQTLLVMPFTADGGGAESFEHLNDALDIYMFGSEGSTGGFQGGRAFVIEGTLSIGSDQTPINNVNAEATVAAAQAEVKVAPTGAAITIEIYYDDGTPTLWLTLTIAAGSKFGEATSSELTAAGTIPADAKLRVDLTSVGTTEPGQDLSVQLFFS